MFALREGESRVFVYGGIDKLVCVQGDQSGVVKIWFGVFWG